MVNHNFLKAYLTRPNGVFTIKHTGEAKNRIDNVNIHIDHQGVLHCTYNDLNWRWNENTLKVEVYGEGMSDFDFALHSSLDPNDVLPDYTEVYNYEFKKFRLIGKNKIIPKTKILVKEGEVRLNKPARRIQARTTTKWYIETLMEEIKGDLTTPNPIL